MEVGVRELKQRLSELLERAASGETIRVTDRGRPKAILGPIPPTSSIDEGIASGWVTPPAADEPPAHVVRVTAKRSSQLALDDDRGE
jgi:prevent-host-death family protein